MREGDIVLIMYTGKSRSAEYKLGRVVAVEVDQDQLVRPCLVWYSLVQNLPKKERDSYKGVTEEQHDIIPLTPEEVPMTKDKVARELY